MNLKSQARVSAKGGGSADVEETELLCYLSGNDGPAVDFHGGIRTSLPDDPDASWQIEPFFLDSGTRPDSAIPLETAKRLKLTIHKDSR